MFTISQAIPEDHAEVRDLFFEYLDWVNNMSAQLSGFTFDVSALVEKDMKELDIFMPPTGRLLLAREGDASLGCACMHILRLQVVELKRMYVRPVHRRKGIGSALLDAIIAESRLMGNRLLRLDSARFMTNAHALYRSRGFREIEPYAGSEVPKQIQQHSIFMELSL